MCWCPAHVGVQQNEAADEAARLIAQSEQEPMEIGVPCRDHYPRIKAIMKTKWAEQWTNTTNNKLRTIKDHINQPPTSYHHNRKLSVILTRLRIGHTLLTHQHLMERRPAPQCIFCDAYPMSIRHILAECTALNNSRQQYFPFVSNTDSLSLIHI